MGSEYYQHLIEYINMDPKKSVCMACEMGAAGPGKDGEHDADCFVIETKAYIDNLRSENEALKKERDAAFQDLIEKEREKEALLKVALDQRDAAIKENAELKQAIKKVREETWNEAVEQCALRADNPSVIRELKGKAS